MKVERIENVGIIELDKPGDADSELFVKGFFEKKGYQVLKLRSKDTSMETENLKELFPFIEDVLDDRGGMPDYLVFRIFQEIKVDDYSIPKVEVSDKLSDWFFVEVKGQKRFPPIEPAQMVPRTPGAPRLYCYFKVTR